MEFPVSIGFIGGVGTLRLLMTDRDGRECGCFAGVSGYLKGIVYAKQTEAKPLYAIEWTYKNTEYQFATASGEKLGSMKRTPRRSIWQAHYVIRNGETPVLEIVEDNPWVKVLDTIVELVPLVGRFTGLFLNPTYTVARPGGAPLLRLVKERSVYEYHFSVHQVGPIEPREREVALLALLMFIQRENTRG
ncbi:MAG: hypothetical protein ABL904_08010 [Hyphomicrobiaceae bacterium]